jgi:hypothetical protein
MLLISCFSLPLGDQGGTLWHRLPKNLKLCHKSTADPKWADEVSADVGEARATR